MCVPSSVAAVSAAVSVAISAAIVYFRVCGNKPMAAEKAAILLPTHIYCYICR